MGDAPRRIRRLALWLGVLPALVCLALAWMLGRYPGADAPPQRDRPYGWVLDPLTEFGQWIALGGSAVFGTIAVLLLIAARYRRHPSGSETDPHPDPHEDRGDGTAPPSP